MRSPYAWVPPSAVAEADRLGSEARERIVQAVLAGKPLAKAWVEEMTRCRAAWRHLDKDTYDLAIREVQNISEAQYAVSQRLSERRPWWRIW